MAWENAITIGCSHGDIFDDRAKNVVQKLIEMHKPKHRNHLGDVFDLRAIRRGAGPEEKADGMKRDLQAGMELLDWYRPQILTLGNHDHRIWRVSAETSDATKAELFEKVALDLEDQFRKMQIKWCQWGVDNYLKMACGGPKLLHGYLSSLSPAKAHFDRWGDCIVAHVHTSDYYEARHRDGGKAFTVGTLADIKKMTYADNYPAKLGWRQSILCTTHNTKTGKWYGWQAVNDGGTWVTPYGIIS